MARTRLPRSARPSGTPRSISASSGACHCRMQRTCSFLSEKRTEQKGARAGADRKRVVPVLSVVE